MGGDGRVRVSQGAADDPFVLRVADGLLARLPTMIDELRARITAEDHYYSGAAEALRVEMHQTIAEQLTQLVRSLAGLESLDFDLPRRLARVES